MEENKFIHFLSQHWSKFLFGILTLAVCGVWLERFSRSNQTQCKQDFLIAHQIFEQFQKGKFLPTESIESTENILKRHPELHPKYDSMLALTFFSQQNNKQASYYAQSMIKHVDAQLPAPYKEYAAATLLISHANYQAAFEAALALESQLKGKEGYATLDAMNTLRLLFLADKLGDSLHKNSYWKKLESHPGYASIQSVFHEGKLSLADYMKQ